MSLIKRSISLDPRAKKEELASPKKRETLLASFWKSRALWTHSGTFMGKESSIAIGT